MLYCLTRIRILGQKAIGSVLCSFWIQLAFMNLLISSIKFHCFCYVLLFLLIYEGTVCLWNLRGLLFVGCTEFSFLFTYFSPFFNLKEK
uniref:Uncharacterized protein n=1 Tax=Rhizophora mucronata TaxID=61149 RepID=A0A2P2JZ82_RHIMU